MAHTLARMLVVFALWSPLAAYALGLGEINLHSALNQPLESEIALLSVRPEEADSIGVKLASNATFEQAGVERPALLSELRFKVAQKSNGNYYVRAYSQTPIKEPFLNFLVEVNWAAGRLVREYTVLLDPPALMSARQPRIQAPQASSAPAPQSGAQSTASTAAEAAPSPADTTAVTPLPAPANDLTQPKDTLWSLAQRLRPDASVSTQQMMLALLRTNPEAFATNNVNSLLTGYRLRIPELSEINTLSQEEALREIKQQNAAWASARPRPAANAPTAADAKARLKLVAATEAGAKPTSPDASALQDTAASIETLQKELTLANETVEARRQENEEMQSRMAELEKQVESMQKLITLKDENLANLQNKLLKIAPDSAATQTPNTTPDQLAQPDATTPVAATPAPETNLLEMAQALQREVQSNPMLQAAAGGSALLLLSLLWLINRRRRLNAATITEADIYSTGSPAADTLTAAVAEEETVEERTESGKPDKPAAKDPLAEIDVYLAYEQYPQAEAQLKQLIANDPDRPELKLRLLELFYLTKNKNAFGTAAENLHTALAGRAGPLWDKAVFMGQQLYPEHPLFTPPAAPAEPESEAAVPVTQEDDMFATAPQAVPEPAFEVPESAAEQAPAAAHAPLDFDFSPEPPPAPETTAEAATDTMPPDIETIDHGLASPEHDLETVAGEPAAPDMDFTLEDRTTELPPTRSATPEPAAGLEFDLELEAAAMAETDTTTIHESEAEGEEALSPFDTADEVGTKLDLARAYLDMGDEEGATSIIAEILQEGNDAQKAEARELMTHIKK